MNEIFSYITRNPLETVERLLKVAELEASKDPINAIANYKVATERLMTLYKGGQLILTYT